MKKSSLTVLIVFVFSTFSLSQIINGDFEDWPNFPPGSDPTEWNTYDNYYYGQDAVYESNNAFSGTKAAKLEIIDDPTNPGWPFRPVLYTWKDGWGHPISIKHRSVQGYYILNNLPLTFDALNIGIEVWQHDTLIVGVGQRKINYRHFNYEPFSVPIWYFETGTPTAIIVTFTVADSNYLPYYGHIGSWAIVDNISLSSDIFNPSNFNGSWVGTWFNHTLQTSDSVLIAMAISGLDKLSAGIIMVWDLEGPFFGGNDPEPITLTGNIGESGFSVSGSSVTCGNMILSGDEGGNLFGRMPDMPDPNIDSTTFSGIYTEFSMHIDYTVYFAGGIDTYEGEINIGNMSLVSVESQLDQMPEKFLLFQNHPNPFNPTTKIRYSIPEPSNVGMKVYDILGREMESLVNEEKPAGTYELAWNAANLPSGVYFYQLRAGDFIQTKKMILLK